MRGQDSEERSFAELANVGRNVFRRYWKIAAFPAMAVLSLGLLVALTLPNYYTSDVLVFISPQRININKVIDSPNKDEMTERLQALVQEILSRPRLNSIIDRFSLYPELVGPKGKELAVRRFRSAITVTPIQSPTGVQLLQTFRLEFTHWDPKTAFEVTKALSNLFIEESVVSRRSELKGTEEFLDAQLNEARKRLEETENSVQQFVKANFGKLPEHLDAAIARLENAQQQLATNSNILLSNSTRRSFIEKELSDLKKSSSVVVAGGGAGAESLDQLKAALAIMLSKYSEKHPDVINTRKRIEALQSQGANGAHRVISTGGSEAARNTARQLNELDAQTASINEENKRLKETIEKLQADIEQMPVKEQELVKIQRDYANVKANYEKLLGAREDAGIQSSLVRSEKASQFRIVEPAELPVQPAGPMRLVIVLGALVLSLLCWIAIPSAQFVINTAYKLAGDLERDLGVTVLGVIPAIATPHAVLLTRKAQRRAAFGSIITFAVGCIVIFFVI